MGSCRSGCGILTGIVTEHHTGAAAVVATACFSLTSPILVGLGLAYLIQSEHTVARPTVKDAVKLHLLIGLTHFVFLAGFAAFLWSYDARISITFVIGCALAWRIVKRFSAPPRNPLTTGTEQMSNNSEQSAGSAEIATHERPKL